MKTAEQYLERGIYKNGDYDFDDILFATEQAQKDAYNEALEDAVRDGKCRIDSWFDYRSGEYKHTDAMIDADSIFKLKKK